MNFVESFDSKSKTILNLCTNKGQWIRDVNDDIIKIYGDQPRSQFREWFRQNLNYLRLGDVQYVNVGDNTIIANMVVLDGMRIIQNKIPTNYEAFEFALNNVMKEYDCIGINKLENERIGLKWIKIELIIKKLLKIHENCNVYISDYFHEARTSATK